MANSKQSKQTSNRRRVSDDITSLDSWSEVTAEHSSKDIQLGQKEKRKITNSSNEVLLNPRELKCPEELPETKVTRIKLLKSSDKQRHDKERSGTKLLRIFSRDVNSDTVNSNNVRAERIIEYEEHTENSDVTDFQKEEYGHYQKRTSDNSQDSEPKSLPILPCSHCDLHTSNVCDCIHCMENVESYKSLPVFPSYDDTCLDAMKSSQPFLKKHASTPFLQGALSKKRHKNMDSSEVEQSEKVKNKIMSVWNNVRYGWTLKTTTNFEKDSPIFLLGRCYHIRPEDVQPDAGQKVHTPPSMELFKRDFQSRLWFTYRRDFQALAQTKFTSDCGWGCMLRSSQMMLAQAFVCHFLTRDWRIYNQTPEQETFYRHIIQWFGDTSSDLCPFSVHRLVEIGKTYGKQPGEWYGPSSVAYIIRDAISKSSVSLPVLKDLCVYVAQDCTVYKQDILELCSQRSRNFTASIDSIRQEEACSSSPKTGSASSQTTGSASSQTTGSASSQTDLEWKRSVIILIPVRLGGEEFNPIYSPCIKNLMAHESCLGLIGGKPKHSLYFIGWQEDKLIYLDPHFCQDYVDVLKRDFKISSYHCFSPRKISLRKMDPSATVGFYCRTREDFDKFVDHMEEMVTPKRGSGLYPMFVFNSGKGSDINIKDLSLSEKSLRVRRVTMDENGRIRTSTVDSEEFVVL